MPIDPSISLRIGQGVTPSRSPIEQYGRILGIRGQQQEQQLNQQNIASNAQAIKDREAAAQAKERETQADKKLGELLFANTVKGDDGEEATNYPAVIRGLAQAGHGTKALALETQWRADQKTQIDNAKAQIENATKTLGMSSSALGSLLNTPDEQLPQAYEQTRQQLLQSGLFKPEQLPDFATVQQQSGGKPRAWLQQQQGRGVDAAKQIETHQKDLEYQQHLLENGPALAEKKLKTAADELKLVGQVLGIAASQEQWDTGLEWLKTSGISDRALKQAGQQFSPESVKRVTQQALTSAERATQSDKNADNARADATAKIAEARAAETERHNRETEERMAKIAAGQGDSLPELKGVAKSLQAPAAAAFSKSAIAYQDSKAAADEIQSVIDLVKSGNKAAGSNLPLLGVGALNAINGIKRMNAAEIHQYQNAGSLYDKIVGKIGSLTEGKPIPADVLNDIEQLHKTLAEGASKKHAGEVAAINVSHGSSFKPMGGGAATKHQIRVNGKVYEYKGSGATDDMKSYTEVKP